MTANFVGQGYGARLEGGYRYAVLPAFAVTPYGAVQFQDFNTPAYNETDTTGGGLGLNVAAQNSTDVRTELGARFDDPTVSTTNRSFCSAASPGRTTLSQIRR